MGVREYIESFVTAQEQGLFLGDFGDLGLTVGPVVGRLLAFLVRLTRPKAILEIGSYLGYSTLWLAAAANQVGGRITAIEIDPAYCSRARANLGLAGIEGVVDFRCGDAAKVLPSLNGLFDMVFVDCDKSIYATVLPECIRLTSHHGIIIADDTLWLPIGLESREEQAAVNGYNHAPLSDPRLSSVILPVGDGLTISVKIGK